MTLLLHITLREQWDRARFAGVYRSETLDTEGFIHCSTRDQVLDVANSRFSGAEGLVLLCIESSRVQAPVQFDAVETGVRFPHIYGPLNVDAVIKSVPFPPGPNGRFALPELPDDVSSAGR